MKSRLLACAVLALSLAALPALFRAQAPASDPGLTAHEWGTFTSIAGKDGRAADWLPLTGSTDLPAFVEHFQNPNFKGGLCGTVRMETPVLYFYTNHPTTLSVHVAFSQGLITEWYPHANRVEPASLQLQPQIVAYMKEWNRRQKQPDSSISWTPFRSNPMTPPACSARTARTTTTRLGRPPRRRCASKRSPANKSRNSFSIAAWPVFPCRFP